MIVSLDYLLINNSKYFAEKHPGVIVAAESHVAIQKCKSRKREANDSLQILAHLLKIKQLLKCLIQKFKKYPRLTWIP